MSDFIVIGGGVAGLSAGARLSDLGRVTLLEAESALGYHASGRSAALFEMQYGLPSVIDLNRASEQEHRAGGYLSPRGLMLLGRAEEAEGFARDRATLRLDEIAPEEARRRVPILDPGSVALAAAHDAAWDIDTDRMLQDCARAIRAAGGRVVTAARVRAIARKAGRWRVATEGSGEVHEGAILVDAAGAWADEVAAMAGVAPLGLQPMRRSMARLAAPGGHDVSGWPMLMGVDEAWYAKPDAGALIVSPAEADPVAPQDAWAEEMVLAEGLARYQEMVVPEVTRPLATWAGLRTFAPDRTLVLGPDPSEPSFFWCAGQGGYGFQTAPAAARLLADLAGGRAPGVGAALAAALSPARLR